jgi:hypothetical protein
MFFPLVPLAGRAIADSLRCSDSAQLGHPKVNSSPNALQPANSAIQCPSTRKFRDQNGYVSKFFGHFPKVIAAACYPGPRGVRGNMDGLRGSLPTRKFQPQTLPFSAISAQALSRKLTFQDFSQLFQKASGHPWLQARALHCRGESARRRIRARRRWVESNLGTPPHGVAQLRSPVTDVTTSIFADDSSFFQP